MSGAKGVLLNSRGTLRDRVKGAQKIANRVLCCRLLFSVCLTAMTETPRNPISTMVVLVVFSRKTALAQKDIPNINYSEQNQGCLWSNSTNQVLNPRIESHITFVGKLGAGQPGATRYYRRDSVNGSVREITFVDKCLISHTCTSAKRPLTNTLTGSRGNV